MVLLTFDLKRIISTVESIVVVTNICEIDDDDEKKKGDNCSLTRNIKKGSRIEMTTI